jgi:hypothetical protein
LAIAAADAAGNSTDSTRSVIGDIEPLVLSVTWTHRGRITRTSRTSR